MMIPATEWYRRRDAKFRNNRFDPPPTSVYHSIPSTAGQEERLFDPHLRLYHKPLSSQPLSLQRSSLSLHQSSLSPPSYSKLQLELATANETRKHVEKEKVAATSTIYDIYKRLQEYKTSLQPYNSKLQLELATANETRKHVESI
ncbi:hypothetical protein LguiA_007618 [Lonicera macranthoides]